MHAVMTADIRKCFQTLGLDLHADSGQAKAAYRRLAKRWHPDRLGRDPASRRLGEERIREVNAAYAVVRRFLESRRLKAPALEVVPTPRRPKEPPCLKLTRETILRLKKLLKDFFHLEGPGPPSGSENGRPVFIPPERFNRSAAGETFEAVLQGLIRESISHRTSRRR
jgi:hypothetical protein